MESVQPKYVPISALAKIWGRSKMYIYRRIDMIRNEVSVPIWGLFNLTFLQQKPHVLDCGIVEFPSPSGDYLI